MAAEAAVQPQLRRKAVVASMRQVPGVVVTVLMFEEAGVRKGAIRMLLEV
jgi:hypothetical protein